MTEECGMLGRFAVGCLHVLPVWLGIDWKDDLWWWWFLTPTFVSIHCSSFSHGACLPTLRNSTSSLTVATFYVHVCPWHWL